MSISEPFIRRPIGTSLLMLGVLVFGIGAYNLLPVAALPKVDFPTIAVTVNYPGASPDTMASAVATPLEQQFAALPGLAEMTSMSGVGATLITLQFDLDRNIDAAAQDVQQAITLDTNDQLFNAAGFRNVIIAWKNGSPVRLGDVAEVVDSVQNARADAWFEGKPAEGLAIQREAGANTIQVVDTIKSLLPKLQQSIPPTVHVDLISDRSLVIRAAVHDVQFTMMLTIGLVILVIFIFLRTLWATVIPSIAVPLSLLATFAVMYGIGYSLDNISLMALTISVGFVVDDAIVMIENIVRYLEQGDPPFEAALKGAGQIGFTIISITFSLIAVFIPLLFMSGIIGRLFREFAVVVSVAVVASAVISLTLTPVMCSLFLKGHSKHPPGRLNRLADRGFQATLNGYDRGLKFVFRHQFATLMTTLVLMAATGLLYMKIPKGFFPQQDTG